MSGCIRGMRQGRRRTTASVRKRGKGTLGGGEDALAIRDGDEVAPRAFARAGVPIEITRCGEALLVAYGT